MIHLNWPLFTGNAVVIEEFGCVSCQTYHRRGLDPEFKSHLMSQSKHGVRRRLATAAELVALAKLREGNQP